MEFYFILFFLFQLQIFQLSNYFHSLAAGPLSLFIECLFYEFLIECIFRIAEQNLS